MIWLEACLFSCTCRAITALASWALGIAHSEAKEGHDTGDLSDVALNWMLWQARAASLQFSNADPSQSEVTQPLLHDDRSSLSRIVNDGDRRIDNADGSLMHAYQEDHESLGGRQRTITEALIHRYDGWRYRLSREVGRVDLQGYAKWLRDELGWQAAPS